MTTTAPARTPPRRASIDHEPAMRAAATEYERVGEVLAGLDAAQWAAPTVNTGWDVRATVGHLVGMMAMVASVPQLVRQQTAAMWTARRAGAPVSLDALTALQVRLNAGLTADELVARHRALAPKAVRGRARIPAVIRRRALPERQLVNGRLEWWTIGFLTDVVLTRDPFMHRLDIHAATGLPPRVTADHEGTIVDDVVREWADRHGRPYTLDLTGPAGGHWSHGDGERITLDALEFCRIVSGRPTATDGLLATAVPF